MSGEQPTREEIAALAQEVSKRLSDEGRLIEAGWAAFRWLVLSPNAPEIQINEMRYAYMAGAQHLFSSILGILDPGQEPTDADMQRMDLIDKELLAFRDEMELRHGKPGGQA